MGKRFLITLVLFFLFAPTAEACRWRRCVRSYHYSRSYSYHSPLRYSSPQPSYTVPQPNYTVPGSKTYLNPVGPSHQSSGSYKRPVAPERTPTVNHPNTNWKISQNENGIPVATSSDNERYDIFISVNEDHFGKAWLKAHSNNQSLFEVRPNSDLASQLLAFYGPHKNSWENARTERGLLIQAFWARYNR